MKNNKGKKIEKTESFFCLYEKILQACKTKSSNDLR